MSIDMEKIRREHMRWLILLTLNNARPLGAYEGIALSVVQSEYKDATALELRREADYLSDRKMVDIVKEPNGRWHLDLTRLGTDIVEYTVDCAPGIARPAKYW
jgi:hypothetical protein